MSTISCQGSPEQQTHAKVSPIATATLLFWLFSYVLFTSRVHLRGDEGLDVLIDMRRFAATAVGAMLYAGVLRFVIFPAGRKPAHPLTLVAAVVPAAVAMVGFRAGVDPLVSTEPLPLGDHVRWVLVWSGYFGLWLIGFHAWRMYSERTVLKEARSTPADPPLHETREALVAAILEEAARLPDAERKVLLRQPNAGYPVSDDPLGTDTERDEIIRRIVGRMAA